MPTKFDLKAAIWAGIIAGLVFLMLEMAMVAFIQGMSPWGPPRMMAAIVMGEGVLPPMEGPVTINAGVMIVAILVHMVLTIIYAVVLGVAISLLKLSLLTSVIAGTLFGVFLYYINFYGFTAVFPWFAMARGGISLVAHAAYGLVLGLAYHMIASRSAEPEVAARA